VDFYDACRSPRVYRSEPIPYDEVLEMIRQGRGSNFDPQIADAFERVLNLFAQVEEAAARPAF
jgi:HD-GYP domain-containing protein (c-di-GMP phosphodiesterase class II)